LPAKKPVALRLSNVREDIEGEVMRIVGRWPVLIAYVAMDDIAVQSCGRRIADEYPFRIDASHCNALAEIHWNIAISSSFVGLGAERMWNIQGTAAITTTSYDAYSNRNHQPMIPYSARPPSHDMSLQHKSSASVSSASPGSRRPHGESRRGLPWTLL
jgi:hypothetical protein